MTALTLHAPTDLRNMALQIQIQATLSVVSMGLGPEKELMKYLLPIQRSEPNFLLSNK